MRRDRGARLARCKRKLVVPKSIANSVRQQRPSSSAHIRLSPSLTINGMSDSNPAPLFGYLAEQLGKRGLAYLHCVEPSDPRGDPFDRIVDPQVVRKAFGGNYIANGSYTGPRARAALEAGEIDAASFGRLFIANPDLPRRLAEDLPMNPLNAARIYSGSGDGYTDYPFYS